MTFLITYRKAEVFKVDHCEKVLNKQTFHNKVSKQNSKKKEKILHFIRLTLSVMGDPSNTCSQYKDIHMCSSCKVHLFCKDSTCPKNEKTDSIKTGLQ